jgi:membrane fusion protein, multidrug efflux system
MKTSTLVIGAVVVALGAGAAWHWHASAGAGAGAADAAPEKADDASVLVRSQPVSQQVLAQILDTFGEIAAGKPESVSFPQPGQLLQLPLVLGQRLRRGDTVAVIGTDPNAVAAYTQASNAVGFAQRELKRQQELADLQLATQSQVDAARKQLEDSQAALAAQARLGGAHASVTLMAPFDAVVTALPVAQGERVAAGAPVAQLGRLDRPRALLAIEPARSAAVKPGMSVMIKPLLDGAAPIMAHIATIDGVVDAKTQMVTAIVDLPASQAAGLAAGTRVEAAITLGEGDAWSVPRQAVLSDEQGSYLFQVASSHAHRVAVKVLGETAQTYGVNGQLDPKLPIVVLGNYELHDGMQVREGAR